MANRKKRHEMKTPGDRLQYFRKKKGLNQDQLASAIKTTRQNVSFWETGLRDIPASYHEDICKALEINLSDLITVIPPENRVVVEMTGLSNASIEFLRELASAEEDCPVSIIKSEKERMSVDYYDPAISDSENFNDVYPSEILSILNYLLSTRTGKIFLSTLYRYAVIDSSSAIARTPTRNRLEKISIPVETVSFAMLGNNRDVAINIRSIFFALKQFLSMLVEDIREEIQNEIREE